MNSLFRRAEEISLVSLAFVSAANVEPQLLTLTLLVSTAAGAGLQSQLENFTGLPSEAPPAGS